MRPRARTRREFLAQSTLLAAGAVAAPAIVTLGCGKPAVTDDAGGEGDVMLRARRIKAAPDGRPRDMLTYDGQYPEPVVRAKEGDLFRIKVVNELDVPTSVHWHGMHQPGTWTMDGVDGVSREPIPPGESFLYQFKATPSGTHWYHSHVGVQYGDGLIGPLIVEEKTPIATYDREEIVIINDWFLESGDTLLARLTGGKGMEMEMDKRPKMKDDKMEMKGAKDLGDVPFQSALINGKGRFKGNTTSPLSQIVVKQGETIRLRLINGSSTYALRFQIDGHPLTVIATDGAPVVPVVVDNLRLELGERYDVLLKAAGAGPAWIRVATLDGNEGRAILRYGAGSDLPADTPVEWGKTTLMPGQLRSPQPLKLAAAPREIPIVLGGSMMPFRWSINDQYYPKAETIELKKDEAVRFVFKNPTMMDHPFHLHGHYFNVLGTPDALNLTDPPKKDTVNVPAKSELVIQWVANNPGRWFFHCHIEWHLMSGMARVIEIKG